MGVVLTARARLACDVPWRRHNIQRYTAGTTLCRGYLIPHASTYAGRDESKEAERVRSNVNPATHISTRKMALLLRETLKISHDTRC